MSVRVTEGYAELDARRAQWDELFTARPNEPSTSFEWTSAMAAHHERDGERRFLLTVERRGAAIGFIPLVLHRFKLLGFPVSFLAPLSDRYNTHSDLLLADADPEIARAIVAALFSMGVRWDCFRMARLLESNPLLAELRRALDDGRHRHAVRAGLPAYVLALPRSYGDYLRARSAKFRNHLKRAERKLLERGRVAIHEVTDERFDDAYDALLQIERASWKHAHGTSIAAVGRQLRFYRDFGRQACRAGRLHLQWMSIDATPVAYNLGYLTAAGYHYLKTSYDHSYRSLGPATVLRARLIESLIERGVPQLDFPGEPYEWEAQWTHTVRRRVVLTVYAASLRGRVLAAADRLRRFGVDTDAIRHVDPRAAGPQAGV